MKVVINTRIGGFGLSDAAIKRLIEIGSPVIRRRNISELEGLETVDMERAGDIGDGWKADKYHSLYKDDYVYSADADDFRNDPALVRVVEELGDAAGDEYADLKIVEIPDNVEFEIVPNEMGAEHIAEVHRKWS